MQNVEINPRAKGPLILIGAFFIVIILIAAGTLVYNAIYNATLEVLIAPESSTITINDKKYKNGTHKVKPGDYHLKVEKDGFNTIEKDIHVDKESTGYAYAMLMQTDGKMTWYEEHDGDMALTDEIISYEIENDAKELANNFPIVNILPLDLSYYSADRSTYTSFLISYQIKSVTNIELIITDRTGGNRETALEALRTRGFEPNDYKINYIDESASSSWGHAID